jgi:hypothetical protein
MEVVLLHIAVDCFTPRLFIHRPGGPVCRQPELAGEVKVVRCVQSRLASTVYSVLRLIAVQNTYTVLAKRTTFI